MEYTFRVSIFLLSFELGLKMFREMSVPVETFPSIAATCVGCVLLRITLHFKSKARY